MKYILIIFILTSFLFSQAVMQTDGSWSTNNNVQIEEIDKSLEYNDPSYVTPDDMIKKAVMQTDGSWSTNNNVKIEEIDKSFENNRASNGK